jgi:hypothetical protein
VQYNFPHEFYPWRSLAAHKEHFKVRMIIMLMTTESSSYHHHHHHHHHHHADATTHCRSLPRQVNRVETLYSAVKGVRSVISFPLTALLATNVLPGAQPLYGIHS